MTRPIEDMLRSARLARLIANVITILVVGSYIVVVTRQPDATLSVALSGLLGLLLWSTGMVRGLVTAWLVTYQASHETPGQDPKP